MKIGLENTPYYRLTDGEIESFKKEFKDWGLKSPYPPFLEELSPIQEASIGLWLKELKGWPIKGLYIKIPYLEPFAVYKGICLDYHVKGPVFQCELFKALLRWEHTRGSFPAGKFEQERIEQGFWNMKTCTDIRPTIDLLKKMAVESEVELLYEVYAIKADPIDWDWETIKLKL